MSETDDESIRSVHDTYASGWNVDSPEETIMSLFEDDAVILPHHGEPQVEGKEIIRNHFWYDETETYPIPAFYQHKK